MNRALIVAVMLVAAGTVQAAMQPLPSLNQVGFTVVTNVANQTNTIISVPYEACLGSGAAGVLTDLISTNGLVSVGNVSIADQADQLVVLTTNASGLIYYYYWLQTGVGWTGVSTEKLMPGGTNATISPPAANEFQIARGLGFWLKRQSAAADTTVLVKGQIATAAQSIPIQPGLNLVGIGSPTDLKLNESGIDWTGATNVTGNTATSDKILIVGLNGTFQQYFYFINPGTAGWEPYAALDHKWIKSDYTVATNATISAGQGFWYVRRGGTGFTLQPGL